MFNRSYLKRLLTFGLAVIGTVLIGGVGSDANAQGRDPFAKPGWSITREARPATNRPGPGAQAAQVPLVPSIEQRIEFFKRLRENAVMNGQPIPKVTSVLTLSEMAVTGIFKTPRGYAAMVEAVPIKLSYTIYPGEKFFDGQLVAVEENQLIFRKVTKVGKDKFVSSVENKTLRQYTAQEQIQGTAPTNTEGRPPETIATYQPPTRTETAAPAAAGPIVSPLDEMDNQTPDSEPKKKAAAPAKKPVRTARKN
ncbi:MAG TPA: hypothetical protein PKD26_01675 [Pyrinomonadaceae bacterium]|nr:hypothetical protein [Pyrinomonadaceae bacterium]